ncbi:MAG: hypothetical protein MJK11_09625 [Pseudomonadales bacterium]|nr:hypothetical protein [Pseudomonadales bacterium]
MNLLNFELADDFIAIDYNGEYLDLHNNYDFYGFEYITSKRKLIFTWNRSNKEWVSKTSPNQIVLEFNGVSLFKCKERDGETPFSEDDCLSSIGFIGNDLIDEIEGFSQSKPTIGCEHLNLSFESGFAVKIEALDVVCNTKSKS